MNRLRAWRSKIGRPSLDASIIVFGTLVALTLFGMIGWLMFKLVGG